MYMVQTMVMVSGHKKSSQSRYCKHSSTLCETTYELTKKLHNCRLLSQSTKH